MSLAGSAAWGSQESRTLLRQVVVQPAVHVVQVAWQQWLLAVRGVAPFAHVSEILAAIVLAPV